MTRVALAGGDGALRDDLRRVARGLAGVELLPGSGTEGADVVVVAGDAETTAFDRCRVIAVSTPCVLVVDDPGDADAIRDAMAAGARGVVARRLDAFDLQRALGAAMTFAPAAPLTRPASGRVVAVTAGAGGSGVSTVTYALAHVAPGPLAILDLDPAGGTLAGRFAVPDHPDDAGLAGEESGARAWERLARPVELGRIVAAPPRPDLAWIVREGVVGSLVTAAAASACTVVADVGRGTGPALEALAAADVVVLVLRPGSAAADAARRHRDFLARIGVDDARTVVCLNGASRADRAAVRLGSSSLATDVVLPFDEDLADGLVSTSLRRRLEGLAGRLAERAA